MRRQPVVARNVSANMQSSNCLVAPVVRLPSLPAMCTQRCESLEGVVAMWRDVRVFRWVSKLCKQKPEWIFSLQMALEAPNGVGEGKGTLNAELNSLPHHLVGPSRSCQSGSTAGPSVPAARV